MPVPARKDAFDFPEMQALTPMQQQFVIAVATRPGVDHTTIMREVNPALTPGSAKTQAWRWMHNPKVQAAMLSLVPGDTIKMYPLVLKRMFDIVDNPQAKDHAKILVMLHEWLAPRHTESTMNVNVTHQALSEGELMAIIRQKLATTGPAGQTLLNALPQPVTDAEFVEVSSLEDLSDVL